MCILHSNGRNLIVKANSPTKTDVLDLENNAYCNFEILQRLNNAILRQL